MMPIVGSEWPPPQWSARQQAEDLVVSTPERVSFAYDTATLGSRFLAQFLDLLVLSGSALALSVGFTALTALIPPLQTADSWILFAWLVVVFVAMVGYFPVSEAVWSGRTLGKLVMRLRVVDARGGPISVSQAIVRNLVRLVDFLPLYYAVGAVTMFINQRGQRLGDLAAGTVVVRERRAVSLPDLILASQRSSERVPTPAAGPAPQAVVGGRRLEPALKRFVAAYAQRRWQLHPEHRSQLATRAADALRAAMPEMVAAYGPLAALERLADEEQGG
jgi:uncharacterized RDD family membrane protein YckC